MHHTFTLGIVALLAVPAPKFAPKPEKAIEGSWILVKCLGSDVGNNKYIYTYRDGKMSLKMFAGDTEPADPESPETTAYTIDAKNTPWKIDFDMNGNILEGIFEIDRDVYKLCCAYDGQPRPKEFKEGVGIVLTTMKRRPAK
jgi:uncharacterized protein (TIGR03067 family)